METKSALQILAALSQETRLRIFQLLGEHGPDALSAGAIGRALGLPPATLSFHVKELAHAGLVSARPRGREVHYSADFGVMRGLVGYLSENCCRAAAAFTDADDAPAQTWSAVPKPNVRPKSRAA